MLTAQLAEIVRVFKRYKFKTNRMNSKSELFELTIYMLAGAHYWLHLLQIENEIIVLSETILHAASYKFHDTYKPVANPDVACDRPKTLNFVSFSRDS